MIKEVIMYSCFCDNCGKVIEFGEGWERFEEKKDLLEWIHEEEYSMKVIGGKHICDNCIVLDEETDEWVVKTKGK